MNAASAEAFPRSFVSRFASLKSCANDFGGTREHVPNVEQVSSVAFSLMQARVALSSPSAMKILLLTFLAFALFGCERKPSAATVAPASQAEAPWEYMTVDMAYLDSSNYPRMIRSRWYEIEGEQCHTADSVANRLGRSGWELVTPHLTGKVTFKRRDTGKAKTEVKERSRSSFE